MNRFAGSIVALPTPFVERSPEHVDFEALRRLIEFQLEGGSDGLVVCGSTGESASLLPTERLALAEFAAGLVRGRVPLFVGVGSGDTRSSLELAKGAERAGADGLLVVTPAYVRPTQRGLARHLGAIADSVSIPVLLYNIPSRTCVDLLPETVADLARRQTNIVAIKEASGSLARIRELVALETIDVLAGEDDAIADCMALGAVGVVSVVANLVPGHVRALVRSAKPPGDPALVGSLVEKLNPLVQALFAESNPTPLKAAMALLGWCSGELRSPLVPLSPEHRPALERALASLGLHA